MFEVRTFVLSGISAIAATVCAEPAGSDLQIVCPGADEKYVREMVGNVRCALRDVTEDPIPVRLTIVTEGVAKRVPRLALVVAVLAALGKAPVLPHAVLGEVDYQGRVHPWRGTFQALRTLAGGSFAIVAADNAPEAAHVEMAGGPLVKCAAVRNVRLLVEVLAGCALSANPGANAFNVVPRAWKPASPGPRDGGPLSAWQAKLVKDTRAAPSALWTIAHPAPVGLLARRLVDDLPALTEPEAVELTAIQSAVGLLRDGAATYRPFRAPHHTVSAVGLVGGGDPLHPGEVTLAHGGVLFLDEVAEFRGLTLDPLRQAMRDGQITIARMRERVTFPARPRIIVARTYPCPCLAARLDACSCPPGRVESFTARATKLPWAAKLSAP